MQEIDKAIKTSMTLTPDCFLDLLFGSKRKIKLKTFADSQITVPELRVDKALLVKEGRQTFYIIIHVFGERVVFSQLPKEVNMLKESRLIKGWMTESEQTGERKGKLSILQKQLHQRIGGMSPELLLKLRKLNDTQLDYLSLALFTINNREDLRAWLNNGAAQASRKR